MNRFEPVHQRGGVIGLSVFSAFVGDTSTRSPPYPGRISSTWTIIELVGPDYVGGWHRSLLGSLRWCLVASSDRPVVQGGGSGYDLRDT